MNAGHLPVSVGPSGAAESPPHLALRRQDELVGTLLPLFPSAGVSGAQQEAEPKSPLGGNKEVQIGAPVSPRRCQWGRGETGFVCNNAV